MAVFGEGRALSRFLKVILKSGMLSVMWMVSCYVYARALTYKSPLDALSLFSTHTNFVYLMSWVLLQKQFIEIRVRCERQV